MAGRPTRIVTGGQTGVDRAALDVALELGIASGGWVPMGRGAEDGRIPDHYPNLRETISTEAAVRTHLNVRDSDATLLITRGDPAGGSALTAAVAEQLGKPLLHVDLTRTTPSEAASEVRRWLRRTSPSTLNVAGPRASEDPTIHEAARTLLVRALGGGDRRGEAR